jgi:antagonist of KipI
MNVMHIERPGLLTTFQDGGRHGFQKYGVPMGGAMDKWAHAVANILVGNAPDAAVLECTLTGPSLRFTENTLIALCGARMEVKADGMALPYDRAILVRRGTLLEVGARHCGARLYIAVRGALAVPPVLGSHSTNLRAHFGGFHGRALAAGDAVGFTPANDRLAIEALMVNSALPVLLAADVGADTAPSEDLSLRMVCGAQWSAFDVMAQTALTTCDFVMQADSDRQGLRLKGQTLGLRAPLELVSEATVFGTVQVPPDGNPIVLMADSQSAGGYPKIATVAGVDLPVLAQCVPGATLRFVQIPQDSAEMLWIARGEKLAALASSAAAALQC